MENWRPAITALVSIFLLFLTTGCNRGDEGKGAFPESDPLQPKPVVSANISGRVMDEAGIAVADAEVMVQGETTITGSNGMFRFSNIQVPGNRCVIQTTKEGYFSAVRAATPQAHQNTKFRIVLMTSPITHTFEASEGKSVALPEGWELSIPPNGLVRSESVISYTGPVHLSLRHLDPTLENFRTFLPGGDMVARRRDLSTSGFASFGILRIHLKDPAGRKLQLAPGFTATLTMNIQKRSDIPDRISVWFFDEDQGLWKEDGSIVVRGSRYSARVTHLSDWTFASPRKWPPR